MLTERGKLSAGTEDVSFLLELPEQAEWLCLLGHGAGVDLDHRSMANTAAALHKVGVGTFRYNFPYKEHGRSMPDRKPVCIATIHAVAAKARELAPGVRLIAGGRSFGGRMTSHAQADHPITGVEGLVFFAFPLHPAGKPSTERADHLADIGVPLLFLQGDKDDMADPELLQKVVEGLAPRATLRLFPGVGHSLEKAKQDVPGEAARLVAAWTASL